MEPMLRFTLQLTAVLNKGLEIFKDIFLTFYNTEQSSTLITDCPTMLVGGFLPPSAVGSDTRTALTFSTPRCSFNWAGEVADTTDSESSEGPVGSV